MKNKFLFLLLFLIIVILTISCSKNDKIDDYDIYTPLEIEEYSCNLLTTISDSFGDIISCDICDSFYVFLDGALNKCYLYNNYNKILLFGSQGSAPGEMDLNNIGEIRFFNESEIVIYDPFNFRVQFFSFQGEFLRSCKLNQPFTDFEIYLRKMFFPCSPIMSEDALIVMDIEDGNIIDKFPNERRINPYEIKAPPPIRMMELGNDGNIFSVIIDEYKITRFNLFDSTKKEFCVDVELVQFDNETIERMKEKVPQLADRIRIYQFPCLGINYDREFDILWITTPYERANNMVFDLFNKDCNYLKRININNLDEIEGRILSINYGKLIFFNQETMEIMIFDISDVYE